MKALHCASSSNEFNAIFYIRITPVTRAGIYCQCLLLDYSLFCCFWVIQDYDFVHVSFMCYSPKGLNGQLSSYGLLWNWSIWLFTLWYLSCVIGNLRQSFSAMDMQRSASFYKKLHKKLPLSQYKRKFHTMTYLYCSTCYSMKWKYDLYFPIDLFYSNMVKLRKKGSFQQ